VLLFRSQELFGSSAMKLSKDLTPFCCQEHANIEAHGRHLGQKYMGLRTSAHIDEMFKDTSIHEEKGGHSVPVNNFLNAQCR